MKGEIRNPVMVIVLSIVTCGIYYFIWIYSVTNEISENLEDESISAGTTLMLSIVTCGLYAIYWFYMFGSDWLPKLNEKKGLSTQDEGTLFLMLGLFCSPVAIFMAQEKLNKLYE